MRMSASMKVMNKFPFSITMSFGFGIQKFLVAFQLVDVIEIRTIIAANGKDVLTMTDES